MTLASELLADNPRFLWKLNETSGTVAEDSSPNNFDGTYSAGITLGAPSIIPAEPSALSADFLGSTSVVTGAAPTHVTQFSGFAVGQTDSVSGTRTLLCRDNNVAGGRNWILRQEGSALYFYVWHGSATGSYTAASFAANLEVGQPYSAGFTLDATTMRLYFNGLQVATLAKNAAAPFNNTGVVRVGASAVPERYDGKIAHAAYFETAIGPARHAAWHAATGIVTRAKVTQHLVEGLVRVTPDARVTQHLVEGLVRVTPDAKVTQDLAEVLWGPATSGAPPQEPTGLAITGTAWRTISASWDGATDDQTTGYEMRVDGGTPVAVGNVDTYTLRYVEPGAGHPDYLVELRATNPFGASDWISVVATTPDYTQVTFSASGSWVVPVGIYSVWRTVLIGGGGGGGKSGTGFPGQNCGGAGGAGGVRVIEDLAVTPGAVITVTVGDGGAAGPINFIAGTNGGDTSFGTQSALGGGGGGSESAGKPGGSGGGGSGDNTFTFAGGAGTAGQGFAGGNGRAHSSVPGNRGSGGGGGAGGVGAPSPDLGRGGNGGLGLDLRDLIGLTLGEGGWVASGGGGGNTGTSASSTTSPGGGGGGAGLTPAEAGMPGTGGGGGGSGANGGPAAAGGSGLVALIFVPSDIDATAWDGSDLAGVQTFGVWDGSSAGMTDLEILGSWDGSLPLTPVGA